MYSKRCFSFAFELISKKSYTRIELRFYVMTKCIPSILYFLLFYVNYTPDGYYQLHSFITLLNHKISICWGFFSISTYAFWRHSTGGQPERKPHCISTLWFSNDIDDRPNRDAIDRYQRRRNITVMFTWWPGKWLVATVRQVYFYD